MKITILTDNTAGGKHLAEHGLSYFIEHNGQSLLFDTGHSDVFLKNAKLLGIDILKDTGIVILSHGHWDHGDGLRFMEKKNLITHPDAFIKRYRKTDHSNIGLALNKPEIEKKYKLTCSKSPYPLSEEIIFLGEIPRKNNFESQTTPFMDENGDDDFVNDDSALLIVQEGELIIISGCAHSGICNTIEYAKKVSGINKIRAVIGGFHLKHNNTQTKETIAYLKKNNVKLIYPAHCTELPALVSFYNHFKIEPIKTGMSLQI